MNFKVKCGNCGGFYELPEECRGQTAECGACGKRFMLPAPEVIDPNQIYVAECVDAAPAKTFRTECPQCHCEYELTSEMIGMQVECGECKQLFIIPDPNATPTPASPVPAPAEPPKETKSKFAAPMMPKGDEDMDRTVKIKRPPKPGSMIPQYNTPSPPPPGHPSAPVPPAASSAPVPPSAPSAPVPPAASSAPVPPSAPSAPAVSGAPAEMTEGSDEIKIHCPHCQCQYDLTRNMIGAEVECGNCQKHFVIEAPKPAAPAAPVAPEAPKSKFQQPMMPQSLEDIDKTVKIKRPPKPGSMIPQYNTPPPSGGGTQSLPNPAGVPSSPGESTVPRPQSAVRPEPMRRPGPVISSSQSGAEKPVAPAATVASAKSPAPPFVPTPAAPPPPKAPWWQFWKWFSR